MSNDRMESPRSRGRVIAGTIASAVVVVAFLGALVVIPTEDLAADAPASDDAQVVQETSPRQIDMVCPSQMELADADSYGDEEFRASAGNLASSARFAAFGSIFHSQVSELADADAVDAVVLSGPQDRQAGQSALIASREGVTSPLLFDTRVLKAQQGTGATGTVASWATEGDLPGMAAAGCIATGLTQSFLVPSTQTGNTQQLVMANPTDKATTVTLSAWDSKGKDVALATNSVITIAPNSQESVMLQAAAPDLKSLYVTVSSQGTPVAAMIRSVSAKGLTALGNDYVMPVSGAATAQAMVLGKWTDQEVSLLTRAEQDDRIEVSWMTGHGLVKATTIDVPAGSIAETQLSDRPEDAIALYVQGRTPFRACARVEATHGQQRDFALVQASAGSAQSALAIPPSTTAALTVANMSSQGTDIELRGYDAKGDLTGSQRIELDADCARNVDLEALGEGTVAIETDSGQADVVWGAFLGNDQVDDADVAAVAYVPSMALDIPKQTVSARRNPAIVQ